MWRKQTSCQCDPLEGHEGFQRRGMVWDGCCVVWMAGRMQALRSWKEGRRVYVGICGTTT